MKYAHLYKAILIMAMTLGSAAAPVTPAPGDDGFAALTRHRGSVRGAWPTVE